MKVDLTVPSGGEAIEEEGKDEESSKKVLCCFLLKVCNMFGTSLSSLDLVACRLVDVTLMR